MKFHGRRNPNLFNTFPAPFEWYPNNNLTAVVIPCYIPPCWQLTSPGLRSIFLR
jgi:hypothetical protein